MKTVPQDRPFRDITLSCTFCGVGTSNATWDVVTEDGVFFVCDIHHVEMSEKGLIRLERINGDKIWQKVKRDD